MQMAKLRLLGETLKNKRESPDSTEFVACICFKILGFKKLDSSLRWNDTVLGCHSRVNGNPEKQYLLVDPKT
jgi:hypothetical protein